MNPIDAHFGEIYRRINSTPELPSDARIRNLQQALHNVTTDPQNLQSRHSFTTLSTDPDTIAFIFQKTQTNRAILSPYKNDIYYAIWVLHGKPMGDAKYGENHAFDNCNLLSYAYLIAGLSSEQKNTFSNLLCQMHRVPNTNPDGTPKTYADIPSLNVELIPLALSGVCTPPALPIPAAPTAPPTALSTLQDRFANPVLVDSMYRLLDRPQSVTAVHGDLTRVCNIAQGIINLTPQQLSLFNQFVLLASDEPVFNAAGAQRSWMDSTLAMQTHLDTIEASLYMAQEGTPAPRQSQVEASLIREYGDPIGSYIYRLLGRPETQEAIGTDLRAAEVLAARIATLDSGQLKQFNSLMHMHHGEIPAWNASRNTRAWTEIQKPLDLNGVETILGNITSFTAAADPTPAPQEAMTLPLATGGLIGTDLYNTVHETLAILATQPTPTGTLEAESTSHQLKAVQGYDAPALVHGYTEILPRLYLASYEMISAHISADDVERENYHDWQTSEHNNNQTVTGKNPLGIQHLVCYYNKGYSEEEIKLLDAKNIPYLHVRVADSADATDAFVLTSSDHATATSRNAIDIEQWFSKPFAILDRITLGEKVLIHCQEGISRSPTIVIAWLMNRFGLSYAEALLFCKAKRPCVEPKFSALLEEYESLPIPAAGSADHK